MQVGSLLRVPFGARSSLGVVVELAERSELDPERLVEPEAVIGAGVGADLVALADWMAREYCSTPSRALQLMLAPGRVGRHRGQAGARRRADGSRSGRARRRGARLNDRQRALLGALAQRGATVAAELDTPGCGGCERRGLVAIERRARPRRPAAMQVGSASATAPPLTAEQSAALAPIVAALGAPEPGHPGFLLQGVTGSGKTEVYLRRGRGGPRRRAARRSCWCRRSPSPRRRCGAFRPASATSSRSCTPALSTGERHDEWMRLRTGEARVCVGPRSAVFAPLEDLGLIVVDEEHESSYKHEGDPRYDARTVARERAAAPRRGAGGRQRHARDRRACWR